LIVRISSILFKYHIMSATINEKAKEIIDALKRSFTYSQEIGSFAVVVDPVDNDAWKFYEKYDFICLPDSNKMFLSIKTLEKLFSK